MSKNILIVTGDGGESYETLYAFHRFQEEQDNPVIAAPSKRRLHLVMHDFEPGWDTYVERQGYGFSATVSIEEAKAEDYDAILILGGRAPEYLRHNAKLLELTRQFDAAGKWIFAICHGIQVLNCAGITKGRRVTCYEHVRAEVEQCGGTYITEQAVRDGRIVTAQTWESHPDFYREVFRCLRSSI